MRVLRILASRRLPCGCLVGIYETYDGPVAHLIDHRQHTCENVAHRPGAIVHVDEEDVAQKRKASV